MQKRHIQRIFALVLLAALIVSASGVFAADLEGELSSVVQGVMDKYKGVYCTHCFPWEELVPNALAGFIAGFLDIEQDDELTFRDVYEAIGERYGETEYFKEFEANIYTDCESCKTCTAGECSCCETTAPDNVEALLIRIVNYLRTLIMTILSRFGSFEF